MTAQISSNQIDPNAAEAKSIATSFSELVDAMVMKAGVEVVKKMSWRKRLMLFVLERIRDVGCRGRIVRRRCQVSGLGARYRESRFRGRNIAVVVAAFQKIVEVALEVENRVAESRPEPK